MPLRFYIEYLESKIESAKSLESDSLEESVKSYYCGMIEAYSQALINAKRIVELNY